MTSADSQDILVTAGSDRFGAVRRVYGVMPFTVKVATGDAAGRLLVIEQANRYRGGPPRHVHHAQDEWFYAVAGNYLVEVDGRRHPLGAGDAILVPRGVPHTWAHLDEGDGRLLIAFTPAGDMEAFFAATAEMGGMPSPEELAPLFAAHGMNIVGPPLQLD